MESIKKRIVLIGKTGSGKSHLGNMITGMNKFKVGKSIRSETSSLWSCKCKFESYDLEIIDTPGFSDNRIENPGLIIKNMNRLEKYFELGVDMIILCLNIVESKPNDTHIQDIMTFRDLFGDKIINHLYVTFTRLDQIVEAEKEKSLKLIDDEFLDLLEEHTIEIKKDRILFSDMKKFDEFTSRLGTALKNSDTLKIKAEKVLDDNPMSYLVSKRVSTTIENTIKDLKVDISTVELKLKKLLDGEKKKEQEEKLKKLKQDLKFFEILDIPKLSDDPVNKILNFINEHDKHILIRVKKYFLEKNFKEVCIYSDIHACIIQTRDEDITKIRLSSSKYLEYLKVGLQRRIVFQLLKSIFKILEEQINMQKLFDEYDLKEDQLEVENVTDIIKHSLIHQKSYHNYSFSITSLNFIDNLKLEVSNIALNLLKLITFSKSVWKEYIGEKLLDKCYEDLLKNKDAFLKIFFWFMIPYFQLTCL